MKFLKNKEISKDPSGLNNVYGNDCSYVNLGHLNPSAIIYKAQNFVVQNSI